MPGKSVIIGRVVPRKAMTVIIRAITEGGFVVAADGRLTDVDKKTILREDVQKIFSASTVNGSFALSMCGGGVVCGVNLVKEFLESASYLATQTITDIHSYLTDLCAPVVYALKDCAFDSLDGTFDNERPGRTVAEIFLDGYLDGYPRCGAIRLFQEDGHIGKPEINGESLPHIPVVHGSSALTDALLVNRNFRFVKYFVHWVQPLQVDDIIRISRSYIDACADPLAIELDDFCLSIGGHLHVATVTRDSGFQWAPGFEPIPQSVL